jgi:hypothetical protein
MNRLDSAEAARNRPAVAGMPPAVAADLKDDLVAAANDLDRLQALLSDACDALLSGFLGASTHLRDHQSEAHADAGHVRRAIELLDTAVTALQFQDLSSQLINHTLARLHDCADRLGGGTPSDDDDGATTVAQAHLRPSPVEQSGMGSGFVELF